MPITRRGALAFTAAAVTAAFVGWWVLPEDGAKRMTRPASGTKKPRTLGMCDRHGKPNPPGASVSVHVLIKDIAPTHTTLNMAPLIAAIKAAKATGASGMTLSLDGGMSESDDAKKFYGSVALADPQGVRPSFTTVSFWKANYQARAKVINAAVAAVIDSDPFVQEFMMWQNGTEFSPEWPIRNASLAVNRDAWFKAGYNQAMDVANILAAPADHARAFKNTLFVTWMPMGFQAMSTLGVKQDKLLPGGVNATFLDNMVLHTPDGILGIDNADLASYGTGRPPIYELALAYHRAGLRRRDQTVTADKMQGGPKGVAVFFNKDNLTRATTDGVYAIEYPGPISNLTPAQYLAAHKQLIAAAPKS